MILDREILIASFDIGKKNFAFCIERTNPKKLANLDIGKRKKLLTNEYFRTIDEVCGDGELILFKNTNLTIGTSKKSYIDPELFHNMTDCLDEYRSYWNDCSIFIVEQQMSFGNRRNTMAIKLGQHCYSYFVINYGRSRIVIDFPSYHKTKVLNAPPYLTKYQRKKWSTVRAKEILEQRGDKKHLEIINRRGTKKDDLADVLCQLCAFKYLAFVEKSI